jgi:hypothetical protein
MLDLVVVSVHRKTLETNLENSVFATATVKTLFTLIHKMLSPRASPPKIREGTNDVASVRLVSLVCGLYAYKVL